jgi:hypothetical protein
MATLTLPSANVPIGTATVNIEGKEYNVEIKMSQPWLQQFLKLLGQVNQNTTNISDLTP